jgi:hypothetical protein
MCPYPILVSSFWFILILKHFSLGFDNAFLLFRMVSLDSVFPLPSPLLVWVFSALADGGFLVYCFSGQRWNPGMTSKESLGAMKKYPKPTPQHSSCSQPSSRNLRRPWLLCRGEWTKWKQKFLHMKALSFLNTLLQLQLIMVCPPCCDGNTVNGTKDRGTTPMDIEERPLI